MQSSTSNSDSDSQPGAGGVHLDGLKSGTLLRVETSSRSYELEYQGNNQGLISGHPKYCPTPVLVEVHGSTWGGATLRTRYLGRGMRLEFKHPEHGVVRTSRIEAIEHIN